MPSPFSQLLGDLATYAGRGIGQGIQEQIATEGGIRRQARLFHAGTPLRRLAREEERAAGLQTSREQYGLKRELEAPTRQQYARILGPILEQGGIFPEMTPGEMPIAERAETEIPAFYKELEPDLAKTMLSYLAAKERTKGSDIWKAIAAMQAADRITQAQQRINLSQLPPPAAEEELQLRVARMLAAQGVDEFHPEFGRLFHKAVEALRAGKPINVTRKKRRVHLGTEGPGIIETILGKREPTERWGERELLDIDIGEGRGGRMRPAQPGKPKAKPSGTLPSPKPQVPQPGVKAGKEAPRYRYAPGVGLVPIGQ